VEKIFPLSESDEEKLKRQQNFRLIEQVIDQLLLEIVDSNQPFQPDSRPKTAAPIVPLPAFVASKLRTG